MTLPPNYVNKAREEALEARVETLETSGPGGGGPVTPDDITGATTVGKALLTAVDAAAARTTAGAAAVTHSHAPADITGSTTVGQNVLTAATAAAARSAIGAGTSSLALGTTAGTAKAGDYAPPSASTSAQGVVELATTGETTTGTDTARATTPAGVKAVADTKWTIVVGSGVTGSGRLVLVATEGDYPSTVAGGGIAGDIVIALGS